MFSIATSSKSIVLGLCGVVFVTALSVAVHVWRNRKGKYNGHKEDKTLVDTQHLYFYYIYKHPFMIFDYVLMVIAASEEFKKTYYEEIERPSDNKEIPLLIKEIPNLRKKNKERPFCYGYSIKSRALLYAHLYRMKLPQNTLDKDRLYIVMKSPDLIYEFVKCAFELTLLFKAGRIPQMPNLKTIENAMKLCSCIVQALSYAENSLLQLPHVSEEILRTTLKHNIRSIQSLARMKSDDRRSMLSNLNDDQYDDVLSVISKMPIINVDVGFDEEDSVVTTAGAIVSVTATLNRHNMSTLFDKEIDDDVSNVVDEKISDLENRSGKSESVNCTTEQTHKFVADWKESQQKLSKKDNVVESQSHSVYCPFFPDNKQEFWWVYITDRHGFNKRNPILITEDPYLVKNLVTDKKVKLNFRAPPQPGTYTYSVNVRSDSYLDTYVEKLIKLDVKEAKQEVVGYNGFEVGLQFRISRPMR